MRDNSNYRAANGRAQDGHKPLIPPSFAGLRRTEKSLSAAGCPSDCPTGSIGSCSFTVSARVGGTSDEWIGIHTNGIHTIPMECIRNGMQWLSIAMQRIAYQCTGDGRRLLRPGERDRRIPGPFHYNSGNAINHREVKACPAALPVEKNWSRPPVLPTPTT